LETFLAEKGAEKPIYIGFGSMYVPDVKKLFTMLTTALENTHNRAVLCTAWSDADALKEIKIPDNVFLCSRVPHTWLFPQCKAVIHHGGAGTTAAGYRAGVPTIIYSFFADQPFWGYQSLLLGVGPKGQEFKTLTAEALQADIEKISEPSVQKAAKTLGEKVRNEGDGVSTACDVMLKYAEDVNCPIPQTHFAALSSAEAVFEIFGKDIAILVLFLVLIFYYFLG
jgi:UDP:flavonoid glycosyltransferase YjiC (YdhE family)